MPVLSTIAAKTATSLISKLVTSGVKTLRGKNATAYELELIKVITASIEEYETIYPVEGGDRIAFYQSQLFFDELLKYRLTKEIDKEALARLIAADSRIVIPTREQLVAFFDIFYNHIKATKRLSKLNIDDNYKEAIFDIVYLLKSKEDSLTKSFNELREDIRSNQSELVLMPEWNRQLEEIQDDINSFRPVTARRRLDKLESRIIEKELSSDRLIARICFLKVQCLNQLDSTDVQQEITRLAFKSYHLQKSTIEYQAVAAQVFYAQGERDKASALCDEMLAADAFHGTAWSVKCFLAEERYNDVLARVPATVKNRNLFKVRFFQWIHQKKYLQRFAELEEIGMGLDFNIDPETPVNAQNRYEKLMTANFFLNKAFNQNPSISPDLRHPSLRKDPGLLLANRLLDQFIQAIRHTEIESSYQYAEFLLHVANFIISEDIQEIEKMESAFAAVQKKDSDIVLKMAQGYNTLGSLESTRKGIALLEKYQTGDELLLYFNASNHAKLGDFAMSEACFLSYLSLQPSIGRGVVINFIILLRQFDFKKYPPFKTAVLRFLDSAQFEQPAFRKLMTLAFYLTGQMPEMTEEEVLPLLADLRMEVEATDWPLSIHIAYGYGTINKPEMVYDYLSPLVDRSRPSEILLLYCKAMYQMQGHKAELMALLQKWREEFGPEYQLLQIESYLFKLQRNWTQVIHIAKITLAAFPDDEDFLVSLFEAAEMAAATSEIVERVPLVEGRTFEVESSGIIVASALIKASQHQVALDILFRQASNLNNIKSRQAYITLSIYFPPGLLIEYPAVIMGASVRIELKGQTRVVEMLDESVKSFPQNILLNKSVGEEIAMKNPILDTLETIKVQRIMNKYLALFDEIVHDAESPLSGLGFYAFKSEEGKPEQMLEMMIKTFGPKGVIESDRLENERRKYFSGEISFTEITNSVFRGHFVDAYFILTSDTEKGFRAITPAITRATFNELSVFSLDFTSFCLFFELTNQLGLPISRKFVISHFLRNIIHEELSEASDPAHPEYSLSFGIKSIIRHDYGENFRSSRIKTFQGMLKWIDDHCVVDNSPDILDYITEIPHEHNDNKIIHLLMANRIMAARENYYLLSNDTFYFRHLSCQPDKVISPISYLQYSNPLLTQSATEFMLKRNYIGIRLTTEILQTELLKMLSSQQNKFPICLENLRFAWNPDRSHIETVVAFLKSLYVMTIISPVSRQNIVSTTLSNLSNGMGETDKNRLNRLLQKEFYLLGSSFDEMMSIFQNVVEPSRF